MWSGGFVSVWLFPWNKNIWTEMGNKEYTELPLERCFLWGLGRGSTTSAECLSWPLLIGPSQPRTDQTVKALMNFPSDSSSKKPLQGCHGDPRTLEVAWIPFHSARCECSSVTCGQGRRDSVSIPFSDQQDQLGSPPSLPPRSLRK